MYSIKKFFHSVLWFSIGLVLNRIKYIILSIIVWQVGSLNLSLFYVSMYLANEFSLFAGRLTSSSYNHNLKNEKYITDKQKLNAVITASLLATLILGLLSAVIVFLLAYPISLVLKNQSFVYTIRLLSLSIPFLAIINQVMQILFLLTRYKEAVIFFNIVETALILIGAYISFLLLKLDIFTGLGWQVVAIIISAVLSVILLYKTVPEFKLIFSKPKLLQIPLRFSPLVIFNSIFLVILNHADLLIVGYFFGAQLLGNYIALLVAPHLVYAIGVNMFRMFPHTASQFYQEPQKITFFSQRVIEIIIVLSFTLTIFILLYPKETLNDILQIKGNIDATAIRLFSLAFFIRITSWLGGQILMATKHYKENMAINIIFSLLSIPIFLYMIPTYSFLGAATSTLTIVSLEVIVKVFVVYNKPKIYFISDKTLRILFIGGIFYIISLLMRVKFDVFILYFPILFIISLLFFRCINSNDIKIFMRSITK